MNSEKPNRVTKSGIFVTRLNWISYSLMAMSLAHTAVNAFKYADSFIFGAFVIIGVISSELLLFSVYNKLTDRDGEGYPDGAQKTASMFFGFVALLFITGGIVAGHLGVQFYFDYILPLSTPVNFLGAFVIQTFDPLAMEEARRQRAVRRARHERHMQKINRKLRAIELSRTRDMLLHQAFMNKLGAAQAWAGRPWRWIQNRRDGAAIASLLDSRAAELLKIPEKSTGNTSREVAQDADFVDIAPGGDGVAPGEYRGA